MAPSYSTALGRPRLGAGRAAWTVTTAPAYHGGLAVRRRAGVVGMPRRPRLTALDRTSLALSRLGS